MRFVAVTLVAAVCAVFCQPAQACYFCEEGSYNTALFAVTVFGLAFAGMALLCVAYWLAGAFRTTNQTELRVLEAEGLAPMQEKPHD